MRKQKLQINFHLLRLIIKFSKILHALNGSSKRSTTEDILLHAYKKRALLRNRFYKILNKYSKYDLQRIYALYYYGRDNIDETTSYYDLLMDANKTPKDEIIDHFLMKSHIKRAFADGKHKFYNHEKDIRSKKSAYKQRLSRFNRQSLNNIWEYKENMDDSTLSTFKTLFNQCGTDTINDIEIATEFLMKIIHGTGGSVVVDFLGYSSFDNLDYVECDKEYNIMKLYWKYSNVECILPPHNVRVDLKFDSLKLYHNDNTIGIAIKGYYQSLKNVKEYFCNIEKVSKFIRKPAEYKMSNFYFETEFDKVVLNKKQECFSVSVLPWRFYNVLVSPKENIGSSLDSTRTLHYINILEIEERLKVTIQKFRDESIYTEDDLTMYGNRYRKIVENMLKLICLAKNFMFNKNYKDDTIGKLLQQLKQHSFYYDENFEKKSDDSVASKIVESQMESSSIVEEILLNGIINVTEEMVVNLNLVSHENVCTKLGADFLEQLHSRTSSLASIVSQYVLPTYVKS